jgi:hypothetical protein
MAGADPDGPFEGVPEHLRHGLAHWWESLADSGSGGYFGHEMELRQLAALLREGVNANWSAADLGRGMIATALRNEDFFLDLIDGTLQIFEPAAAHVESLRRLLDISGSAWTVASDNRTLIEVVSVATQATYAGATSVADEAAKELEEAWANAFGRNGDPSDAWDHAIKAIEDVLVPVVVPNKANGTLGDVLGQLRGQGTLWKMVLPGKDQSHDVAPLVSTLELIWPNHDRHGGNTPKRTTNTAGANDQGGPQGLDNGASQRSPRPAVPNHHREASQP